MDEETMKGFTTVELAAVNLIRVASRHGDRLRDGMEAIDPELRKAMLLLGLAMMEKIQESKEFKEMGVN